jgi:hypothetical protein
VKFISKLRSVVLSETVSLLSPINSAEHPKAAEITREEMTQNPSVAHSLLHKQIY